MAKQYQSAAAFRMALHSRLQALSQERGVPFNTLQLKFVIERLLARLFAKPDPGWLLKGGFALELRYRPRARTTKDVDLAVGLTLLSGGRGEVGEVGEEVRAKLQEAAEIDLGDSLSFRFGAAQAELAGAPRGGARYPCEVLLGGKTYARFHVDAGVGDAVTGEPERLRGEDLLAFAGVPPAEVLAISRPQQFAEKVHAYTFPWGDRVNTRTKDLVDLVLLIETGLEDTNLRAALRATFSTRNTHPLPESLAPPPDAWRADFAAMAAEARLSTTDLLQGFAIVKKFWDDRGLGNAGA